MSTFKSQKSLKVSISRSPARDVPYEIRKRIGINGHPVYVPEFMIHSTDQKKAVMEAGFVGRIVER